MTDKPTLTDADHPDFRSIKPEQADYRGPYGYRRPAHGSDPAASYSFDERRITLPTRDQRTHLA